MKFKYLIDKNGRLFGKYDLFAPLIFLIIALLLAFLGRVALQKDHYVTVELFATAGEWWWENPSPPYWLTDPLLVGATEYDSTGKPIVEILDIKKIAYGDRKMVWMKARLQVSYSGNSKQYKFRRDPLEIGSLIYISPDNIKINSTVVWIEGEEDKRQIAEKEVHIKLYNVFPWYADKVQIGARMKSEAGEVLAEIMDKIVTEAEIMTTDSYGNTHARKNPLKRDLTLKLKIKTMISSNTEYFTYFQPVAIGSTLGIPLDGIHVSGDIIQISTSTSERSAQ